jgi:hypothetical protein
MNVPWPYLRARRLRVVAGSMKMRVPTVVLNVRGPDIDATDQTGVQLAMVRGFWEQPQILELPFWHGFCPLEEARRFVRSAASTQLKHEEAEMLWILRTLAIGLGKAITLGEYRRIRNENQRQSEYGILMILMSEIAKKRLTTCKPDELSRDCPMAFVIQQYYQEGRTSSGTAPLRIFTIVGLDGEIINIQGFDLSQRVKITVKHTNGQMDYEEVDPSDALKRIEREAGYRHYAAHAA